MIASSGNEIQLVISAKDEATKTIAKVRGEMAMIGSSLTGVKSAVGSFGSYFGTELNLISKAAKAVGAGIIGLAATTAYLGVQATKTAANLEAERMGFITLLGSADKADAILKRIKKDAASTPFELPGLIQANKLLTSVVKDGDRAEDMLLNVGKALSAMGKGQNELDRIIVNLQQIGAVGHASMIDIKQFAFAGIPIFEMLAEATGKSGEALQKMISDGKITFDIMEKMFKEAGEGTGRFAKAYENMQGTFTQLMSNMFDSLNILGAELIVQSGLFDIFKGAIAGATEWVNKNKDAIIAFVKDGVEKAKVKVQEWIESMGGKDGIQQKLKDLWNTLVNEVIPAIQQFINIIIPIIGYIIEHREGIIKLIVIYEAAKFAAYAWNVATAVLNAGLVTLNATIGILKGALSFLLSTLGIVITVVVAVTAIAWKLNDAMSNGSEAMTFWRKVVMSLFGPIGMGIELIKHWKEWVDKFGQSWESAKAKVISSVKEIINWINKAIAGYNNLPGTPNINEVRYKQFGGETTSGTPYIVGEHRPEVFVPHQSGSIKQLEQTGGNKEITINFNNVSVRNEGDIEMIVDRLKKVLNRQQEMYQIGAM